MEIHSWETEVAFDPVQASRELRDKDRWVSLGGGSPACMDRYSSIQDVLLNGNPDDLPGLQIRDPSYFKAGLLHNNVKAWQPVLEVSPDGERIEDWLLNGVDVEGMFKFFRGNFKGVPVKGDRPPKSYFPNAKSCAKNPVFVANTLEERLRNGSLELMGRHDNCEWPECIMPLTLEPTKPRLCHDERLVNLFVEDLPIGTR